MWKNVLGHAAYILEGMRSLHDIPSFTMQVEYNNVRIQDEFIYGMISNSTSVGGFKGMTGYHADCAFPQGYMPHVQVHFSTPGLSYKTLP